MELNVKIAKILESQSFVSKKDGLTYVKHHFVGTTGGQYPKSIAFSVMGDDKFKEMGIVVGGEYTVYFDVNAHEWNGKWFNDVSCWRCVPVNVANTPTQVQQQAPQVQNVAQQVEQSIQQGSNEQLPF